MNGDRLDDRAGFYTLSVTHHKPTIPKNPTEHVIGRMPVFICFKLKQVMVPPQDT